MRNPPDFRDHQGPRAAPVVRGLRNAVARYGVDAAFVTDLGEDPFEAIRHAHRLPSLLLFDPNESRDDIQPMLTALSKETRQPLAAVVPAETTSWERPDMTVAELHPGALTVAQLRRGVLRT